MVYFLIYHILLLGPLIIEISLACTDLRIHFLFIHLFCLNVLEKLFDFGHLKVIVAYCPNKPVEVLLELQVFSDHNQGVERARLHISKSPTHFDLLLHPVPISQIEDLYQELDVTVNLNLLQMVGYLRLLLILQRRVAQVLEE